MIREIYKSLFIGDFMDAKAHHDKFDWLILVAEDIRAVSNHPTFPLVDGVGDPALFWDAVVHTFTAMNRYKKVLVFCAAGVSRSVAVILGAMMLDGTPYNEAYEYMRCTYPKGMPDMFFLDLLQTKFKLKGIHVPFSSYPENCVFDKDRKCLPGDPQEGRCEGTAACDEMAIKGEFKHE